MRSHASPRLTQSDHTLEMLDERGAVVGALSIEISGVAAMRQLLQSVRGPLAPPPPLAGGGGGGELLLLACGELQVWPEASRSAASTAATAQPLAARVLSGFASPQREIRVLPASP